MPELNRREFVDLALRVSGGAGAALLLSNCTSNSSDNGGGAGGATDFLTAEARAAALDDISTYYDTLPHTSLDDDNQKLQAHLAASS